MRHAVLSCALLAWSATAAAQDAATDDAEIHRARRTWPAPAPDEPTPLVLVEEGQPRPPAPPDVVARKRGHALWVERHLEGGRRWIDPFLGPELYPEISVGDSAQPRWDRAQRELEIENALELKLYVLELRFPSTFADGGRPRAFSSRDADLRIPIRLDAGDHHRLLALVGALVPLVGGATEDNSGAHALLGYGYSRGTGTFQLYGGLAVEPDPFAPGPRERRSIARYGGSVGVGLGDHVDLHLDADLRNPRGAGYDLFVTPGVHFWPRRLPTLQIGLAALLALEEGLDLEKVGGIFELSYNFL